VTSDPSDYRRLGRAVLRARLAAGFEDTEVWAQKVGRSTRTLLGLERGEKASAGPKTLALVESALEWSSGTCDALLNTTAASVGPAGDDATYVSDVGPQPALSGVEDETLAEQIRAGLAAMQEMRRRHGG